MEAIWIKKESGKNYTTVRDKAPPKRGRGSWIKLTVPKQEPECIEDYAGNSQSPGFWAFKWYAHNDNGNVYPFYYFGGNWNHYQPRTAPATNIPVYMMAGDVHRNGDSFTFDHLRKGKVVRPPKSYVFGDYQKRALTELANWPEFKGKLIGNANNPILDISAEQAKALSAQAREKGWKVEQMGMLSPRVQTAGRLRICTEGYIYLVYRDRKPWFATPNANLVNRTILKELGIDFYQKIIDAPVKPARKSK